MAGRSRLGDGLRAPRLGRRSLLLSGALGAAATLARAPLTRAAGPVPNTAHTVLVWQPYWGGPVKEIQPLYEQAALPFLDQHPSLQIQWSNFPRGDQSALTAAILAGNAPDLIENYESAQLMQDGLFLDLDPYLKANNVDPYTIWPRGQVDFFRRYGRLNALPASIEWVACWVNLTMLDQQGLKYPSPNWDYKEAEALYRALAKPSSDPKKRVYGGWFSFNLKDYNAEPQAAYFAQWGGSPQDPANYMRSTLSSPGCVAATEWMADLISSHACGFNNIDGGDSFGQAGFLTGQVGVALTSDWLLATNAQQVGQLAFNTDFWPLPAGPRGSATFGSEAFDAIPISTKYPEAAWELLSWMSFQPNWSRLYMQLYLLEPGLNLNEEYIATIRQVAPPLRHKNLAAFVEVKDHATDAMFPYNDAAAAAIVNTQFQNIWSRKATAPEALLAADRQVNALERTSAAGAAAAARAEGALQAELGHAAKSGGHGQFPAPSVAGVGTAGRPASSGAVSVKSGVVSIVGTGGGVLGADDGLTFACAPWTGERGTFTCRVVSVSAVAGAPVNNGAKVGLMARGALSSGSAMTSVELALGRGVHVGARPEAGLNLTDQRAGETPGLLAAQGLLATPPTGRTNYLVRPLWLRLVQDVDLWSAFTSLDGVTWLPAGRQMGIAMAGAWVGVFVTPHDSNSAHRLSAAFDHVSIAPSRFMQIG